MPASVVVVVGLPLRLVVTGIAVVAAAVVAIRSIWQAGYIPRRSGRRCAKPKIAAVCVVARAPSAPWYGVDVCTMYAFVG
jgi:hypothetical protein